MAHCNIKPFKLGRQSKLDVPRDKSTQIQSRHKTTPVYSSFIVTFISMLCILYKEFKTIVDENQRKSGRQRLKVLIMSVAPAVRRVKG